jgi:hypothetical protein
MMIVFSHAAEVRSRSNWLLKPLFDKNNKEETEWETTYDGRR